MIPSKAISDGEKNDRIYPVAKTPVWVLVSVSCVAIIFVVLGVMLAVAAEANPERFNDIIRNYSWL